MNELIKKIYEELEIAQADSRYKKFKQMIEEEINNFMAERVSEIGMGINMSITRFRSKNCPADEIVDLMLRASSLMINKSPERAFEFRKEFQEQNGDLF